MLISLPAVEGNVLVFKRNYEILFHNSSVLGKEKLDISEDACQRQGLRQGGMERGYGAFSRSMPSPSFPSCKKVHG